MYLFLQTELVTVDLQIRALQYEHSAKQLRLTLEIVTKSQRATSKWLLSNPSPSNKYTTQIITDMISACAYYSAGQVHKELFVAA